MKFIDGSAPPNEPRLCFLCEDRLHFLDRVIQMEVTGAGEVIDERSYVIQKLEGDLPEGIFIAHVECLIRRIQLVGIYGAGSTTPEDFD